jgi:hypothetical protein
MIIFLQKPAGVWAKNAKCLAKNILKIITSVPDHPVGIDNSLGSKCQQCVASHSLSRQIPHLPRFSVDLLAQGDQMRLWKNCPKCGQTSLLSKLMQIFYRAKKVSPKFGFLLYFLKTTQSKQSPKRWKIHPILSPWWPNEFVKNAQNVPQSIFVKIIAKKFLPWKKWPQFSKAILKSCPK